MTGLSARPLIRVALKSLTPLALNRLASRLNVVMRSGDMTAAHSRRTGMQRTRSDEPQNEALRLSVRRLIRQEARLVRLLPISDRMLRLWLIGAYWLDRRHTAEMQEAIDCVLRGENYLVSKCIGKIFYRPRIERKRKQ